MKNPLLFSVPEQKRVRVIVHTDCKNEADDQYALAHFLMTPRFDVKGIVAGHFEVKPTEGAGLSMQKSYDEIIKVLDLMGLQDKYKVYKGAEHPLKNEKESWDTPGARFIIEEAMKDDAKPLFVAFLGAITDLACAYLIEPKIAERMTAIWIGGGAWPVGEREFNLMQDIHAANVVFQSPVPFWQIPKNVYKMLKTSITELQCRVYPYGELGRYLFQQLVDLNMEMADYYWPHGESWVLGDNPAVAVLLEDHEHCYEWLPAPRVSPDMFYIHRQNARPIRVYNSVDSRLTLEDFFCKLQLHYPAN
jgi:inosine-uridine nucleoside N-ribohydrolase